MSKPTKQASSGRQTFMGCVVLIALVVIAVLIARTVVGAMAGGPHYSLRVRGGNVPSFMTVGTAFHTRFEVTNTGAPIRNLVMDLSGITSDWTVRFIDGSVWGSYSAGGSGTRSDAGDYYAFGPLGHGGEFDVYLNLVPKDAGRHWFAIGFDNGWTNGVPNGSISGVAAKLTVSPAL